MSNTLLKIVTGGIIILLLFGAGFCTGYKTYPKVKPCPVIDTTTIVTSDPYWHNIVDKLTANIDSLKKLHIREVIKWKPVQVKVRDWAWIDSVMKANEIKPDSAIKAFYSTNTYRWEKLDTGLLEVDLLTTVTQNKPIAYDLRYKILKPLTITKITEDNSITYNKYVYAGLTIPMCFPDIAKHLNETTVDLVYAFPKGYAGVGYQGLFNDDQDYLLLKGGVTLFKFKTKK